jgi:hypothetical protein
MNEADDFDGIVIKSMALTKEELDDIKRQLQNLELLTGNEAFDARIKWWTNLFQEFRSDWLGCEVR